MEYQTDKIRRSSNVIKLFMVFVVLFHTAQYYQTHVIDLGVVAGAVGFLALFRGLLLSPLLLITPMRSWFKNDIKPSKASHKYFVLAIILFIVSLF